MAALVAALVARPTRIAQVSADGRTFLFPLPVWSVRTGSSEGSAVYLGLGDPLFPAVSGEWRQVEQMGSAHTFTGSAARMTVVTRKRSRWVTEMRLSVAPSST